MDVHIAFHCCLYSKHLVWRTNPWFGNPLHPKRPPVLLHGALVELESP